MTAGDDDAARGAAAEPGAEEEDLRREGERIAQLVEDLSAMAGAPVGQRVEELVRRLMHLYGAALASLLRLLVAALPQGLDDATRARLRGDALLSSLLVLHDLHPDEDAARAYDPGPAPAPAHPPAHAKGATAAGPAGGLVQIDLSRSRGAGAGSVAAATAAIAQAKDGR